MTSVKITKIYCPQNSLPYSILFWCWHSKGVGVHALSPTLHKNKIEQNYIMCLDVASSHTSK